MNSDNDGSSSNHPAGSSGAGGSGQGLGTARGGFTVEDLTTGPHAHGFGETADGRTYAFRVRGTTLLVEVYPAGLDGQIPDASDVEATAEQSVQHIDLADERSVVAAVRDAIDAATPVGPSRTGTTIRAFLGRIGSVIDGL